MAKQLLPLKISRAAIDVLLRARIQEPFFLAIKAIIQNNYDPSSIMCSDPMISAALAIINRESVEAHEKKSQAGLASAVARLGNRDKPPITIPKIIPPRCMKNRTISGVDFSPILIMQVRYIMLVRNYGASEADIFIRDTLKRYDTKLPSDELIARANSWDNYNRGCRFPQCPEFYQYYLKLISAVSPEDKGYLIDNSINVIITENEIHFYLSDEAYNIMKREGIHLTEFRSYYTSRSLKPVMHKTEFR